MRAVVQRVLSAKVEVGGEVVSQIGPGLCVLAGILETDAAPDAEYLSRKILNMRLWDDVKKGRAWDQSVTQRGYELLLVSQFTLYGVLKGNKPDFHVAMKPQLAKEFYEGFVERVRKEYRPEMVKDGIFGAMMQVHSVNDGPVTMLLDSKGNGTSNSVLEANGSAETNV